MISIVASDAVNLMLIFNWQKMYAVADLARKVIMDEGAEIMRQMERDELRQNPKYSHLPEPSLPTKLFHRLDKVLL